MFKKGLMYLSLFITSQQAVSIPWDDVYGPILSQEYTEKQKSYFSFFLLFLTNSMMNNFFFLSKM